jgi:hypothetical protein
VENLSFEKVKEKVIRSIDDRGKKKQEKILKQDKYQNAAVKFLSKAVLQSGTAVTLTRGDEVGTLTAAFLQKNIGNKAVANILSKSNGKKQVSEKKEEKQAEEKKDQNKEEKPVKQESRIQEKPAEKKTEPVEQKLENQQANVIQQANIIDLKSVMPEEEKILQEKPEEKQELKKEIKQEQTADNKIERKEAAELENAVSEQKNVEQKQDLKKEDEEGVEKKKDEPEAEQKPEQGKVIDLTEKIKEKKSPETQAGDKEKQAVTDGVQKPENELKEAEDDKENQLKEQVEQKPDLSEQKKEQVENQTAEGIQEKEDEEKKPEQKIEEKSAEISKIDQKAGADREPKEEKKEQKQDETKTEAKAETVDKGEGIKGEIRQEIKDETGVKKPEKSGSESALAEDAKKKEQPAESKDIETSPEGIIEGAIFPQGSVIIPQQKEVLELFPKRDKLKQDVDAAIKVDPSKVPASKKGEAGVTVPKGKLTPMPGSKKDKNYEEDKKLQQEYGGAEKQGEKKQESEAETNAKLKAVGDTAKGKLSDKTQELGSKSEEEGKKKKEELEAGAKKQEDQAKSETEAEVKKSEAEGEKQNITAESESEKMKEQAQAEAKQKEDAAHAEEQQKKQQAQTENDQKIAIEQQRGETEQKQAEERSASEEETAKQKGESDKEAEKKRAIQDKAAEKRKGEQQKQSAETEGEKKISDEHRKGDQEQADWTQKEQKRASDEEAGGQNKAEAEERKGRAEKESLERKAEKEKERGILGRIWDSVKGAFNSLMSRAREVWNAAKEAAQRYIAEAKQRARAILDGLKQKLSEIKNRVRNAVASVRTWVKDKLKAIGEAVVAALAVIDERLAAAVRKIAQAVADTINKIKNALKDAITAVWNGVKAAVTALKDALVNTFNAIANWVREKIAAIGAWLKEKITAAAQWLKDKYNSIKEWVKQKVTEAWNALKKKLSELKDKFLAGLKAIGKWISEAWAKFKDWAEKAFVKFWTGPWRDLIIGIAVAVLIAAVTVATGGVGLVVIVAISAAATGAMRAGGELAARRMAVDIKSRDPDWKPAEDENAASNKWYEGVKKDESWGTSFKHAGIEGAKGAVEGAVDGLIGGAGGALATKAASSIGKAVFKEGAKTLGKKVLVTGLELGAKTAIDSSLSLAGDITKGYALSAIDVAAGNKTWDEAKKEYIDPNLDPKSIVGRVAGSAVGQVPLLTVGGSRKGLQDTAMTKVFGESADLVKKPMKKFGKDVTDSAMTGLAVGTGSAVNAVITGQDPKEAFLQGFAGGMSTNLAYNKGVEIAEKWDAKKKAKMGVDLPETRSKTPETSKEIHDELTGKKSRSQDQIEADVTTKTKVDAVEVTADVEATRKAVSAQDTDNAIPTKSQKKKLKRDYEIKKADDFLDTLPNDVKLACRDMPDDLKVRLARMDDDAARKSYAERLKKSMDEKTFKGFVSKKDILEQSDAYIAAMKAKDPDFKGDFDYHKFSDYAAEIEKKYGIQLTDADKLRIVRNSTKKAGVDITQEINPEHTIKKALPADKQQEPEFKSKKTYTPEQENDVMTTKALKDKRTEIKGARNGQGIERLLDTIPNAAERDVLKQAWSDLDAIGKKGSKHSDLLTFQEKKLILDQSVAYLKDFRDAIAQGQIPKSKIPEIFSTIVQNQRKLAHQTITDKHFITSSDHGVKHVLSGNMKAAEKMMNDLNMSPRERLLVRQATIDHDMGYTAKSNYESGQQKKYNSYVERSSDHPVLSTLYIEANKDRYIKIFGEDGYKTIHDAVLDHSNVKTDFDPSKKSREASKQRVASVVSAADCLGATYETKLQTLYKDPRVVQKMTEINKIIQGAPKDKDQQTIQRAIIRKKFDEIREYINTSNYDSDTKKAFLRAVDVNLSRGVLSDKGLSGFLTSSMVGKMGGFMRAESVTVDPGTGKIKAVFKLADITRVDPAHRTELTDGVKKVLIDFSDLPTDKDLKKRVTKAKKAEWDRQIEALISGKEKSITIQTEKGDFTIEAPRHGGRKSKTTEALEKGLNS